MLVQFVCLQNLCTKLYVKWQVRKVLYKCLSQSRCSYGCKKPSLRVFRPVLKDNSGLSTVNHWNESYGPARKHKPADSTQFAIIQNSIFQRCFLSYY